MTGTCIHDKISSEEFRKVLAKLNAALDHTKSPRDRALAASGLTLKEICTVGMNHETRVSDDKVIEIMNSIHPFAVSLIERHRVHPTAVAAAMAGYISNLFAYSSMGGVGAL